MTKGILVAAQNNDTDNYVEQACLLAMSLSITNNSTPISIMTNDKIPKEYKGLFDKIIPIPWGDMSEKEDWKIQNRWKLYHVTPYDETIVMDTDMLILQDLTNWWKMLDKYPLYFTSQVQTYRGEEVTSDYYRKTFLNNDLPNLYTGFYYFKKNNLCLEFFELLELIVNNWELFYEKFTPNNYPKWCSIDVSAAIAIKIMGVERHVTNKNLTYPTFTHMKPAAQDWFNIPDSWLDKVETYVNKDCQIRIGNWLQSGIFHYTNSDFVTEATISKFKAKCNVE